MHRLALTLGALALAAPFAAAQTSTWNIDPMHSSVNFTVKHLTLSNVNGHFGGLKGAITLNDSDITKSTVSVTIDTTTIDTGVQPRDNDLKSPNYFDVAQFPTATFTSTSVSGSAGHLTVNGNLTLHGVTRPVTLEVDGPAGPIPGMDKKPHAGYSATTTLKRKDFGIGAKTPDNIVSDEIKLTIDLDVAKQ
ncbi:YceI family protein [Occallatibacter riparius]|uniref:YceI family protein n=1 Tax=Occallatibacter riparius TaxID=1002689 RepID=A0A9J7BVM7_9BACT|nr:YceI family protein [Occallatibacter riparius]UWZ86924.1 YceI family protein [Occallatibacter riparius]